MVRRLRVQRLRFLLNRSLYLLPSTRYEDLIKLAPDVDEFFEFRSSVQAILDRTADPVLPLPGPAVSAFASLCNEFGCNNEISYEPDLLNSKGSIDSVCTLASLGILTPPSNWIDKLPKTDAEMVRFCTLLSPTERDLRDHSYEDELRTLQLGESKEIIESILTTRFNDLEQVNLDALLLDGYGAS